jgi:hypothetical protein
VVECYWPAVTDEAHAAAAGRARVAARELARRGRELAFLGSILIPAEETVFCLFAGRKDDVLTASRQAGLPLERVLESITSNLGPSPGEKGTTASSAPTARVPTPRAAAHPGPKSAPRAQI